MTPSKITREDAFAAILETNQNLSELSVGVGRLEERLVAMERAQNQRNEQQDKELATKLDAIQAQLTSFQAHSLSCPINQIEPKVDAIEEYIERYPSMAWLAVNRTKAMLVWAVFAISMLVLTVAPWANRQVLGALLKFAGVPDPIVELIIME